MVPFLIFIILVLIIVIIGFYNALNITQSKQINDIKKAEEEAKNIIDNANKISDDVLKNAKEKLILAQQKYREYIKNMQKRIETEEIVNFINEEINNKYDEGKEINNKRYLNKSTRYNNYDAIIQYYEMFLYDVEQSLERLYGTIDLVDFIKLYNECASKTLILDCLNEIIVGTKRVKKYHTALSKRKNELVKIMIENYEKYIFNEINMYFNGPYSPIHIINKDKLVEVLNKYINTIDEHEYLFEDIEIYNKYTDIIDNLRELLKMTYS